MNPELLHAPEHARYQALHARPERGECDREDKRVDEMNATESKGVDGLTALQEATTQHAPQANAVSNPSAADLMERAMLIVNEADTLLKAGWPHPGDSGRKRSCEQGSNRPSGEAVSSTGTCDPPQETAEVRKLCRAIRLQCLYLRADGCCNMSAGGMQNTKKSSR
jgi:hypothetical protein